MFVGVDVGVAIAFPSFISKNQQLSSNYGGGGGIRTINFLVLIFNTL